MKKPLYIHSLFRSGSTFIFEKLRTLGYWCYYEPFNEQLLDAAKVTKTYLPSDVYQKLRHPELSHPYFWEYKELAHDLPKYLTKEFCYDFYFTQEETAIKLQSDYINWLKAFAKYTPVFSFCRTGRRQQWMSSNFEGHHIFLLRDPISQWMSYKINDYFRLTNLLILNAKDKPAVFICLQENLAIPSFHFSSIHEEFDYFRAVNLSQEHAYMIFFALWLDAYLNALQSSYIVDMDRLTCDNTYQSYVQKDFVALGIGAVDLSDVNLHKASILKDELQTYQQIEAQVVELFECHGIDCKEIYSNFPHNGFSLVDHSPLKTTVQDNLHVDLQRARLRTHELEAANANLYAQVEKLKSELLEKEKAIELLYRENQELISQPVSEIVEQRLRSKYSKHATFLIMLANACIKTAKIAISIYAKARHI